MNPKRSPLKSEGALLAQQAWRRKLQAAFLQRNKANRLSCVQRLRQLPSYQAGAELYYTGFTADEIDRLLSDQQFEEQYVHDDLRLYEASCETSAIDGSIDANWQMLVLCPVCQRDNLIESESAIACACGLHLLKSASVPDLLHLRLVLSSVLERHPHPCRPRFQADQGSLTLRCDRCQATDLVHRRQQPIH